MRGDLQLTTSFKDTCRSTNRSARSTARCVEAYKLQLQQFLDEWHFRVMCRSVLGKTWTRRKAVNIAVELLRLNGLPIEEESVEHSYDMNERTMIAWLAGEIPLELANNLDSLFKQLLLILQMVTRVRTHLEAGDADKLIETIEECDGVGIGHQLLKEALVAAAREVNQIHRLQDSWINNCERRLKRLLNAMVDAEYYTQQSLAIEAQMGATKDAKKMKMKSMLMGFTDADKKSQMHTVFSTWVGYWISAKAEKELRHQFESSVQALEQKYVDRKRKSFANCNGFIMKAVLRQSMALLAFFLSAWVKDTLRIRMEKARAEISSLETSLENAKSEHSAIARRTLSRMVSDKELAVVQMVFRSFVSVRELAIAERENEESVKNIEHKLKALKDEKRGSAGQVLERIQHSMETGLLNTVFSEWTLASKAQRHEMLDAVRLEASRGNFKTMVVTHRAVVANSLDRVVLTTQVLLLLRMFSQWHMDTKVSAVDRYFNSKIDHKRRQLKSVGSLFKGFAKQLNDGLSGVDGDSSSGRRRGSEMMEPREGEPFDKIGSREVPSSEKSSSREGQPFQKMSSREGYSSEKSSSREGQPFQKMSAREGQVFDKFGRQSPLPEIRGGSNVPRPQSAGGNHASSRPPQARPHSAAS